MIAPSRYINPEGEGQMSDMNSSRLDMLYKHIKQNREYILCNNHITNKLCELHRDTITLISSYCFTVIFAVHVMI